MKWKDGRPSLTFIKASRKNINICEVICGTESKIHLGEAARGNLLFFSRSKQRMYVAIMNLLEEPQNNLKIFKVS